METKNADNDKNEDVNIDELVNEVVDNNELATFSQTAKIK